MTIDSGETTRQPRGLRILAMVVSVAKFLPPLAAVVWLFVILVTESSDPVDCGDDPTCGEGFGLWLFFMLIAGVGLVVGGILFALQVVAAFRPAPMMLLIVGALLLGLDLGVLVFFVREEVDHPAPAGSEFFIGLAVIGTVVLGQVAIVAWAAVRTFGRRVQSAGSR